MTKLYQKVIDYLALSDKYRKAYKELLVEKQTTYIRQRELTWKTKEIFDKLPDFDRHFSPDIYEPHGIFQVTVEWTKIFVLHWHEQILVITPTKTFTETTR